MPRGAKRKTDDVRSSLAEKRGTVIALDETNESDVEAAAPTPSHSASNQTVIEYLESQRDEAIKKIRDHGSKAIAAFREEAAQAKQKLLASLSEESKEPPTEPTKPEKPLPSIDRAAKKIPEPTPDPLPPRRSYGEQKTIHITCTGGVYSGQKFDLVLSTDANRVCHIGRSSGKKYKAPHGLSLPKDPEISTTHAEIRWSSDDDHIYITDQNSTNGTRINGRNIKPRTPVRLDFSKPIKATFGSTNLTFTM
ncbi:unnamed protein product [Aphanomyces euteiches]|uniref:FHA domain-containing protein n=1 Tax=Aphanomyces euteiches TaxID=100861 RepID=A0A6G0XVK9_9STRA|nr:hypothetical protein Ae201684_001178 [Aphanomyces euteiches]KAH9099723.1 hypothetical protein Ae201684P_018734 [Aphanomyces euteiches]